MGSSSIADDKRQQLAHGRGLPSFSKEVLKIKVGIDEILDLSFTVGGQKDRPWMFNSIQVQESGTCHQ